jgi:hypothetical protein
MLENLSLLLLTTHTFVGDEAFLTFDADKSMKKVYTMSANVNSNKVGELVK